MPDLQNLPIGKSSFGTIREKNDLYVDKTRFIHQMVSQGDYYFLSRPRRFGKSLTISTLRCLFEGRRDLFEGLWIAENARWEWKEHPVILLDFNEIGRDTPENLKTGLVRAMANIAEANDLPFDAPLIESRFKELIIGLSRKTGRPVVILVDEYDKPIIDHLGKGDAELDIARANRDILKQFFGVIKGGDVARVLRFVFITGVSKFSRVSIFSDLNNLEDLTMVEEYAEMLGYTQEELEAYFNPYLELMAEKRGESVDRILYGLRDRYNGYRFSKLDVRVYNPYSVLSALKQKDFKNYWFETGTPTFLVNLLRDKGWYLPKIEKMQVSEAMFSVYDLDRLQPEALLFQTGYVTIEDVRGRLYTFDYPNQEVKTAFLEMLLDDCTRGSTPSSFLLLAEYLTADDLPAFMETMTAIYASIPYTLEMKRDEAYFHTVFYLMVSASGVDTRCEVLTSDGRIDLVAHAGDKIYIMEFKCNQGADTALQQIRENGYHLPYRQRGKQLILVGIDFDTEKRNVAEWKVERE